MSSVCKNCEKTIASTQIPNSHSNYTPKNLNFDHIQNSDLNFINVMNKDYIDSTKIINYDNMSNKMDIKPMTSAP
jgi:hypothetical protein